MHTQELFDANPSPDNRSALGAANANLRKIISRVDQFWAQKARMQWLENGDKNTAFYHVVVKGNRRRNTINRLKAGRVTLVNSVLSSIPVYLATSTSIPMSIMNYIERACANFFWSGTDGIRRRHWVAWADIQRPIDEGGLGVRNIKQVQLALAVKQIWNVYHGSSLWPQYARNHFLHAENSRIWGIPGVSSRVWSVAHQLVQDHTRWVHGNGNNIDVLPDVWLGDRPLTDQLSSPYEGSPATLREVIYNANQPIRSLLPSHIFQGVVLTDDSDNYIWGPAQDGIFSVRSAYNLVRSMGVYTDFVLVVSTHPLLASPPGERSDFSRKGCGGCRKRNRKQSSDVWKEKVKKKRRGEERGYSISIQKGRRAAPSD
ncbi:hypothetical protein Taro_007311 [Colocasia esculenta]|uniref:Uncharacterized protein n=1 Tax=Colocasia esculenta TaxID=4460 RepID=A0A843TZX6_COLES|nr:hypothetical protein [Colocasia esculenta]